VGVRMSKSAFEVHDSANAQIDHYSNSTVRDFIKKVPEPVVTCCAA